MADQELDALLHPLQEKDQEAASNCLSRWSFSYLNPLIELCGRNGKLEVNDLWRHRGTPQETYDQFLVFWTAEQKNPTPALTRAMWKFAKSEFYFSGLLYFIGTMAQFGGPILLNQIVRLIEVQNDNDLYGHDTKQCEERVDSVDTHLCDASIGYVFPALIVLILFIQSICQYNSMIRMLACALKCRTALVYALYKKSLTLSSIGMGSSSVGMINNLMSNDAQQILQIAPMLHVAWIAPLQVAICFFLLSQTVGWTFVTGFGVILILIPFLIFIVKKVFALRVQILGQTDERVKATNDVLDRKSVV